MSLYFFFTDSFKSLKLVSYHASSLPDQLAGSLVQWYNRTTFVGIWFCGTWYFSWWCLCACAVVFVCVRVSLWVRERVGGCGAKRLTWLPSWPASRKLPPNIRSCCNRPPWRPWHTFTKKYAPAINSGVDYELTAHRVGCVGVKWATAKQPRERWGRLHLCLITGPLISSSRQVSLMTRKGGCLPRSRLAGGNERRLARRSGGPAECW